MFADVEDGCLHGIPAWLCEDLCPESGAFDDEPNAAVVDLAQTPGARLALQCQSAGAIPELLSDVEALNVVEGTEGIIRWATGLRARMLAVFADRHPAGSSAAPPGADAANASPVNRWLPDEVGLTLGIPRLEALGEIALAQRFAHVLPDTLAALERGRIDLRRAEAIAGATLVLPDDKARTVEAAVLPKAPDATLRQLRDRVRRAIVRVDPDGEYRRHRAANTERRASIRSLDDGMASLWFYGSAEQIEAAWQMADRLARALGPEDPRTLDQRRFDLAMQVLQGRLTVTDLTDVDTAVTHTLADDTDDTSGDGECTADDMSTSTPADAETGAPSETTPDDPAGPPATSTHRDPPADPPTAGYRVPPEVLAEAVADALARRPDMHATVQKPLIHVVVGLDTLLGDERAAELIGHGPISAQAARALAADGVWKRLVTDPLSGTLLDQGRTTYTPSAGLGDHVRARDQVCRGPHCGRRIRDLDHHQPWAATLGPTAEQNLFGYCRHHHMLKDAPGWQVIAHPDRSLTWISPNGRRHTTEPYDYRPFTDQPTTATLPKETTAAPPSTGPPPTLADDPPPF
ncbi:MAG: 13E12 repeat family protein [Pseudonocardia sp.]|nr:13E12 repeat family protein [Pseudonocardia sp.]